VGQSWVQRLKPLETGDVGFCGMRLMWTSEMTSCRISS
jgi:hypothetical protein